MGGTLGIRNIGPGELPAPCRAALPAERVNRLGYRGGLLQGMDVVPGEDADAVILVS